MSNKLLSVILALTLLLFHCPYVNAERLDQEAIFSESQKDQLFAEKLRNHEIDHREGLLSTHWFRYEDLHSLLGRLSEEQKTWHYS